MNRKLKQLTRQADIFGYPVGLNFDKQGHHYNTTVGGILSFIILGIVLAFTGARIYVMSTRQQLVVSSVQQQIDPNSLGQVNINQTGMVFFVQFDGSLVSPTNLSKYLDIYFLQTYSNSSSDNTTTRRINVNFCSQYNFGYDEQDLVAFDIIHQQGLITMCPDLRIHDSLTIQGDKRMNNQDIQIQDLKFVIDKCTNFPNRPCANDFQIQQFMKDVIIYPKVYQKQIDFNKFGSEPVFKALQSLTFLYAGLLYKNTLIEYFSDIRLNQISTFDDILWTNQFTQKSTFYDLNPNTQIIQSPQVPQSPNIFKWHIQLSNISIIHQRQAYGIINIIIDVGGFSFLLYILFNFLLQPIAKFNFLMKAMKRLYLANTKDHDLFRYPNGNKIKHSHLMRGNNHPEITPRTEQEFIQHRLIFLTCKERFHLFLSNIFPHCYNNEKWPKFSKLQKLYDKGVKKMQKDMDVIKIIRELKVLKIYFEKTLLSPQLKFQILHDEQNLIDLDQQEERFELNQIQGEPNQIDLNNMKINNIKYSLDADSNADFDVESQKVRYVANSNEFENKLKEKMIKSLQFASAKKDCDETNRNNQIRDNDVNSVQISENQFKISSQGDKFIKEHKKKKKMDRDMINETNKKLKNLIKSKKEIKLDDGMVSQTTTRGEKQKE